MVLLDKGLENLTTNQIVVEIKELQFEHENVKKNIINMYDYMLNIENNFIKLNDLLKIRLGDVK